MFYSAYHQPAIAPAWWSMSARTSRRSATRSKPSPPNSISPGAEGPATLVSSAAFWDDIETRARYWGGRVGVAFGEPLYHEGPLCVDLPPGLNRTA
ncbi:MAG: hypothetical protein HC888_10615 [Candidatus Competibacteraceae bacterium]|nr:hypothetical protein [Candidatus Competibacteraceae bacterium]